MGSVTLKDSESVECSWNSDRSYIIEAKACFVYLKSHLNNLREKKQGVV